MKVESISKTLFPTSRNPTRTRFELLAGAIYLLAASSMPLNLIFPLRKLNSSWSENTTLIQPSGGRDQAGKQRSSWTELELHFEDEIGGRRM